MGRLFLLGDCPLAFGDDEAERALREHGLRLCAWCGGPLPIRRRRWCSDACSKAYGENHTWTTARARALIRDGRMCRICLRGPGASRILALLLTLAGHDPKTAAETFVDENGLHVWRGWTNDARLEVNHVVPRHGQGYSAGCWNHPEGLETLCHDHHVVETRRQRHHRLGRRTDPDPRVEQLRLSA